MSESKQLKSKGSAAILFATRFLFFIACMLAGELCLGSPFSGAYIFLSLYIVFVPLKEIRQSGNRKSAFQQVASYHLYAHMRTFATISLDLGVMMFFFYTLLTDASDNPFYKYMVMAGWFLVVVISIFLSSLTTRKRWLALALSEFFAGAIIWILGAIFMLRTDAGLSRLLWTIGWGIGIALIYGSLTAFGQDFYAVAKIADQPIDEEKMASSNDYIEGMASLISTGVMLLVLTVWLFVAPSRTPFEDQERLGSVMLQLPILFMLIAFIYALKQPLDKRNREKLMLYLDSRVESPRIRENLHDLFIKQHRVSYGVKIFLALLRPLFGLKTKGVNYLQRDKYPSVFVCNHGFIDGPIASVIYLPTYFRPWIHDEMLDIDKAYENIAFSFSWVFSVFGKRLGRVIVMTAAKVTCWALRSFNPIPVTRGASREVFVTMEKSLDALEEGDNIMIFPEKPGDRTIDGATSDTRTEDLRSFYTGFAHIGKMYYDKTGKALLFYPVYSNRKKHVFIIGEPVQYDPSLPPHESKRSLAEQLQQSIEELAV